MKTITGAKFYVSNVKWFDGNMVDLINKIAEKKGNERAKWIDNHVKKLLPIWVIKLTPKLKDYNLFRFLVKHIFDIDISILSDPSPNGKTIVTIGQRGKEIFSKKFT